MIDPTQERQHRDRLRCDIASYLDFRLFNDRRNFDRGLEMYVIRVRILSCYLSQHLIRVIHLVDADEL